MKILRIEIVGFGKWRQKKFDFTSGNQLIYGENEAGKSTIYQFIQAVLFGFPSKGKKKKDYTPKDGSAYGGKIWLEHSVHGEFIVERYKQQNRGKSKVTFDGQVGSDELLTKLIAPLTRELFQQVFTFQQEQLIELEHLREKELHDALISLGITAANPSTYATEYYVVKMVKNQDKGNDMDKFKDELKEIATQAKINDSAFTTKVIGEELKAANVKIKDDAFKNILTPFTETSSTASTEDSATQTTESSETKSTDSTKASETKESTTDSTK